MYHTTRIHPWRRLGLHLQLCRARVSLRSRARAGHRAPQPRRPVSERRQRRAEHGDAVHRRAVLRPPSGARHSRGQRAADRQRTAPATRSACNPRLTGLRTIFDAGQLALIQRTGYENSSRSHFQGTDIWSTANVGEHAGAGMARTLPRYAAVAGRSAGRVVDDRETCRTCCRPITSACAAIPSVAGYAFATPNGNTGAEAQFARQSATRIASHVPVDMPHLAFVNGTAQQAFATLDRVAAVGTYVRR